MFGPLLARIIKNDGMNSGGVPGVMTADFYNSLGAMHGTIMVFLGIVPVAFAAFGNYVVPLQIGAPDMTFPKINMASFHSFWVGGVIMLLSFFCPTGPAKSGWTSYPPLADLADPGAGLADGPDAVDSRDGLPDHLVAARRGEFRHHDHPASRARA